MSHKKNKKRLIANPLSWIVLLIFIQFSFGLTYYLLNDGFNYNLVKDEDYSIQTAEVLKILCKKLAFNNTYKLKGNSCVVNLESLKNENKDIDGRKIKLNIFQIQVESVAATKINLNLMFKYNVINTAEYGTLFEKAEIVYFDDTPNTLNLKSDPSNDFMNDEGCNQNSALMMYILCYNSKIKASLKTKPITERPLVFNGQNEEKDIKHLFDEYRIQTKDLSFSRALYFSAITSLTVGYGDITPISRLTRFLAAIEAMLGAIVLSIVAASFFNWLSRSTEN